MGLGGATVHGLSHFLYHPFAQRMENNMNRSYESDGNVNQLFSHLIKIIEANDSRFSFEGGTGGEKIVMKIFDKAEKIGYAVHIEPIRYDENGEPVNL